MHNHFQNNPRPGAVPPVQMQRGRYFLGLLYERDNYKHLTLARFSKEWIVSAPK